tara:strand:+ start:560 stop:790 length:231 start_codon:yes stop_codon:yes gene_type:complete
MNKKSMSSFKKQKYQYLYLKSKIEAKEEKLYWYNDHCGFDTSKDDLRCEKLNEWLEKINKKYGYVNETIRTQLPSI